MNTKLSVTILLLGACLSVSGCSKPPEAATAEQAIEQSRAKPSIEEQADYLVGQANAFVNSEKFDEAILTAKYVLANLDATSEEAKSVLEKAGEKLKKVALDKAEELKGKIGTIGQ